MQSRTDSSRSLDRGDRPGLVASVILVNVPGAAPALLGGPNSERFRSLEKPWFDTSVRNYRRAFAATHRRTHSLRYERKYPPGAAFGVVRPAPFAPLGVAAYLVRRRGIDRPAVRVVVGLFALQFAFTLAWTPAFLAL